MGARSSQCKYVIKWERTRGREKKEKNEPYAGSFVKACERMVQNVSEKGRSVCKRASERARERENTRMDDSVKEGSEEKKRKKK